MGTEKRVPYWDTFVDKVGDFYEIQIQSPGLTFDLLCKDLSFAEKVLEFIEKTRGISEYFNTQSEDGTWTSNTQELCLNKFFKSTKVSIVHFGEYDSSYILRVKNKPLRIILSLNDSQIDSFIGVLKYIRDTPFTCQKLGNSDEQ